MRGTRSYQRAHLRAPYREAVLFGDQGHIHRARALNISEGGLLLDELPEFPEREEVGLLLRVPVMPAFRNYDLLKLQTFSGDLFAAKVIRAKGQLVRQSGSRSQVDEIFRPRFGLQFSGLSAIAQRHISDYVEVFASNLIYLQMLIDSWNTDEDIRLKTRALARVLGYRDEVSIAELRHQVGHDYLSLQWD